MDYCPECKTHQLKGGKFCVECGTALGEPPPLLKCPHCGEEALSYFDRFCNSCGKPITRHRKEAHGEKV
jgi:uncharacterized membrane protein YvbJ